MREETESRRIRGHAEFGLIVLAIIVSVEVAIMLGLTLLPPMPEIVAAGLDALVLSAVSAPLIWIFVVKPLRDQVSERQAEVRSRESELQAQIDSRREDGQILRALSMAQDKPAVLSTTSRTLQLIFPNNKAEILLGDSSRANLHVAASSPVDQGPGCTVTTPAGCPAVLHGHPLTFPESQAIDACPHLANRSEESISAVCVPINVLGSTSGVLHMTGSPDQEPITSANERLRMLGDVLGSRLSMIRALSDSQIQAALDPLTGMLNRRSFSSECSAHLTPGTDFAVIAMDFDHFKRINDTHGHATGDQALRVFAKATQRATRKSDIVARIGGEEFAIVLPNADARAAVALAERIRSELETSLQSGSVPAFTVSAGVADSTISPEIERVLEHADEALFRAKDLGRDRVEVAGATPEIASVTTPGPITTKTPSDSDEPTAPEVNQTGQPSGLPLPRAGSTALEPDELAH